MSERDEEGHFPGCHGGYGCEATACRREPFLSLWREEQWQKKREAERQAEEAKRKAMVGWQPDGRYVTDFEASLLESVRDLVTELRALTTSLRRRR